MTLRRRVASVALVGLLACGALPLGVTVGRQRHQRRLLGALQTRMYPTIGFKLVANCERLVAASDPGQNARLAAIVDDARNRGRRAGDEAAVAAGSPARLATDLNIVQGSPFADVITTRDPVAGVATLGVSRGPAGQVAAILQRPPTSGRPTFDDLVFGKSGDDVIDCGAGRDTAIVDTHDRPRNCESIVPLRQLKLKGRATGRSPAKLSVGRGPPRHGAWADGPRKLLLTRAGTPRTTRAQARGLS